MCAGARCACTEQGLVSAYGPLIRADNPGILRHRDYDPGQHARKETIMETQARKSPHTLFWIAGIAVTLFSVAGIAAIMGWIPASTGGSGENIGQAKPPAAQAKPAAANAYKAPAQPPVQVATNAP